ncbi:cytochrome c3 family protein [Shewanella sp. PP-Sp27a-2]
MTSGELLGKSHGDAGITCKDCHVNGTPKIPKSAEKINLGDKLCLNCHIPESVNSKVSFKFKGHDVFPHSEHVGDIQCADCHSMHHGINLDVRRMPCSTMDENPSCTLETNQIIYIERKL